MQLSTRYLQLDGDPGVRAKSRRADLITFVEECSGAAASSLLCGSTPRHARGDGDRSSESYVCFVTQKLTN